MKATDNVANATLRNAKGPVVKRSTGYILLALASVSLAFAVVGFIADQPQKQAVAQPAPVYATYTDDTATSNNIMGATNVERAKNGLQSLATNEKLNKSACLKLDDMVRDNYWAHINPNGTTPWDFFKKVGYTYKGAGENLAYGQATTSELITAWLNSPTHKKNMLNSKWTEQGVCTKFVKGYLNKDVQLTVHHFGVQ